MASRCSSWKGALLSVMLAYIDGRVSDCHECISCSDQSDPECHESNQIEYLFYKYLRQENAGASDLFGISRPGERMVAPCVWSR